MEAALKLDFSEELEKTPEGWMDEDNQIRVRLKAHLQSHPNRSQRQVADAIGISGAALSGFVNGTYPGNVAQIAAKIKSWLDLEEQRALNPVLPEFVMTSVAADATTVCQYASRHSVIGMIYGDAGLGKTIALDHFVKENPGTVTFITAHVGIRNPKACVRAMMKAVGCKNFGTLDHEMNAMVEHLQGTGRTIVIDEAQHLSYRALEAVRYIQEAARIGVIFSGNDEIYSRLYGRGEAAFAQFYSRVAIRCHVKDVTRADIELIFSGSGLSQDCLDKLYTYAVDKGKLRTAINIFRAAAEIAKKGVPMTVQLLETVRKRVQMGD